ncbi:glycosyltransferase family 2 protein [Oceanicoccus sp. KOV_DT_Chl]|uniref:glycosyltransferase family 2 protein n=1 Tax=Oceanicoccus sp. KOV_DT_Chl TaxID=1904639 RepID=UPI000C7AF924|nr:glycosyltransferase family 2 protein [Oceanicoccus sp. KOV_DT_Chl]
MNNVHYGSIAVVLTCFNRKEKTVDCLRNFFASVAHVNIYPTVYLVDDGSSDGTGEVVKAAFPQVNILTGDGNLFWNGGMRKGLAAAMEKGFDFYLWLNDDTILYESAMADMFCCFEERSKHEENSLIVVGATKDVGSDKITYGGVRRESKWRPVRFRLMALGAVSTACDSMNGNCVMVTSAAADVLGNLEAGFTHGMGDIDYGLRAKKAGIGLWVPPVYVGECPNNPIFGSFDDVSLPLSERWRKIRSPKGLPFQTWYVLTRRHAGLLWPVYFLWPYLRVVFSSLKYSQK